jgi:hypothetical protein
MFRLEMEMEMRTGMLDEGVMEGLVLRVAEALIQ